MKPLLFTLALMIATPAYAQMECKNHVQEKDVLAVQKEWGDAIVAIGQAEDSKLEAEKTIDRLYAYEDGMVLFKPTLASEDPFRGSKEEALSYFVGGSIKEDKGFALAPYTNVRFDNEGILTECETALAMGEYYFTKTDGSEIKVEYTFGYKRADSGELKIVLHHSSLPYSVK